MSIFHANADGESGNKLPSVMSFARQQELAPPDRSFQWALPNEVSQQWVDDLILRAHCAQPVWADYALVEERPTPWEIAHAFAGLEDRLPLVTDDSVVVVVAGAVEILITVSAVPVGQRVCYQVGLHLLRINAQTLCAAIVFRGFTSSYGLLQYPDSDLIDDLKVTATGDRDNEYVFHKHRKRLVFLFPRAGTLSRRAKDIQDCSKQTLSAFGVCITNDGLYRSYKRSLHRSFDILAIAPGGEAWPIERSPIGELTGLAPLLEAAALLPEVQPTTRKLSFSRTHWLASKWPVWELEERREAGRWVQSRWPEVLTLLSADTETTEHDLIPENVGEESDVRPARQRLELDDEGYPIRTADIAEWVDRKYRSEIHLLPRARRELAKSRHPEPRRIAEALELLAGPKLRGYRGVPATHNEFNAGLVRLRMRDGFSNAQCLSGHFGDAYRIQLQGRWLFFERHLCSNASGFNDPRMVRIYYVYDRASAKIVVGWLPTHLPTTQS